MGGLPGCEPHTLRPGRCVGCSPARLPIRVAGNMADAHAYQVVIEPDGGFAVCIWEPDKLPRYVGGFRSEAEARAWIAEQQKPDRETTDTPE